VWICWFSVAVAEEDEDATIVVEETVYPSTTANTIIEVDEKVGFTATLSEVLQQQSSGVSSINLQEIPLHMLDKVNLYRAHTPLRLMTSAMGGVVDMHLAESGKGTAHAGVDSWTNWWLRGSIPIHRKESDGTVFFSTLHANNEFRYFDNQNTPFNLEDDAWESRINNDLLQINFLGTWSVNNFDFLHTSVIREQGIPGHITVPTPNVRLLTQRHISGLRYSMVSSNISHDFVGWHSYQNEILDDTNGELGQGEGIVDWKFHMAGAKGFHLWHDNQNWFPSLGWILRLDHSSDQVDSRYQRIAGQLQLGQEIFYEDWEFSTGVNVHCLSSQEGLVVFAPKMSLLWHLSDINHTWISLVKGFRPPDFTEIYGNTGAIVGNPSLVPETGLTLDFGWTRLNSSHWLSHLQLSAFGRQSENEIIFIQNAQRQSIPLNFEQTRVLGVEGEGTIELGEHWAFDSSISYTYSENRSELSSLNGKELPNLPKLVGSQQMRWKNEKWWLGTDVYWSDGNYWDASNQRKAPTRFVHNATIRHKLNSINVEFAGRNLWDRIVVETPVDPLNLDLGMQPEAVQDFLGYPLMGRSVSFSLTWIPNEGNQ
jgi:outer membrane receptor protein involved in Fe transport